MARKDDGVLAPKVTSTLLCGYVNRSFVPLTLLDAQKFPRA